MRPIRHNASGVLLQKRDDCHAVCKERRAMEFLDLRGSDSVPGLGLGDRGMRDEDDEPNKTRCDSDCDGVGNAGDGRAR